MIDLISEPTDEDEPSGELSERTAEAEYYPDDADEGVKDEDISDEGMPGRHSVKTEITEVKAEMDEIQTKLEQEDQFGRHRLEDVSIVFLGPPAPCIPDLCVHYMGIVHDMYIVYCSVIKQAGFEDDPYFQYAGPVTSS